ncbi:phage protein GemA/Gp16 family protein [Desulfobulbus sp.]|uniref:phage protein GemA/Gp16 family protein n=1 Tax=Desulfobulbus sp. TaxID=895 RepID=UPI0027B8E466|nr:phage protein GemA/Gp16 family protein [Desulfobulbus sp.]
MITNTEIKRIKTLQRVCGLDDDTYRDILRNRAGVNSCKDLRSPRQIQAVIGHLCNLADKAEKKVRKSVAAWRWEDLPEGAQLLARAGKVAARKGRPSMGQLEFIFGLWWSLRDEWSKGADKQMEATLNHFLENGRGGPEVKVASWQWMTADMAHHLIEVLKGRVASRKRNGGNKKNEPRATGAAGGIA